MAGVARHLGCLIGMLVLAGCAGSGVPLRDGAGETLELVGTPFFPQERYQCGPAALATVLSASGVEVRPDDLVDRVYVPERRGSLQAEIIATARSYGRLPYPIPPTQDALIAELRAGRPVLVLQNLGIGPFPRWHYAVVIGMDTGRDEFVLRSGTQRRRITARDVFMRTWSRSERWGLVLLAPGELSASAEPDRYLKALAAAEATGHEELARAGYQAALGHWPEQPLALLGLGNLALAEGDAEAAEAFYRRVLRQRPSDLAATNNLAEALARRGRYAEAERLMEAALTATAADHPLRAVLEDTLADLRKRRERRSAQD